MIEYDKIIILIYIKTYNDTYSYEFIRDYLGFTYTKLDHFIDSMIDEGILKYNEKIILQVTDKGQEILKQFNLDDISFEYLMVDYKEEVMKEIKIEDKLGINDIYIPKYFNEKFKGYGNKKLS